MATLDNLLQSIDKFYKVAIRSYVLIKNGAPEDRYSKYEDYEDLKDNSDLYEELSNIARSVSSSDLSEELLLIAEIYKKSLDINNGYNTVMKGIFNFKNRNSSELDDEDNPNIENILNKCINDLNNRMGTNYSGDSPQAIALLQKAHNEFVSGSTMDEVSEEELKRAEERDIQDQKREIEESDYPEEGKSVIDMTGGIGGERSDKSRKPGIHVIDGDTTKNWIYHYELEKSSYQKQLEDEPDPEIKNRIKTLIKTIESTINNYNYLQSLLGENQNEETSAKRLEIEKEISNLRKEMRKNKLSIRNRTLEIDLVQIHNKLNHPIKDDHQKYILKQKADYFDSLLKLDVGKRKENKLRKKFIKLLDKGYKGSLNPETGEIDFSKEEKAIAEAKAGITPRKKYNKETAKTVRNKKEIGDLGGLNILLGQQIASFKKDLSTVLKNKLKRDPIIFKYIKAIDSAEQHYNKDPSPFNKINFEKSKKDEADFVTNYLNNHLLVVKYRNAQPELYLFRDKSKLIEKLLSGEPISANLLSKIKEIFGEKDITFQIQEIIIEGQTLITKYNKDYDKIILTINKIITALQKNLQG